MNDLTSVSLRAFASTHRQNIETLWHFSCPLSPCRCEMPIKDTTSSVTHQPFQAQRRKVLQRLVGLEGGSWVWMWWCKRGKVVELWLAVKVECVLFSALSAARTGACSWICNIKQRQWNRLVGCLLKTACCCIDYDYFNLLWCCMALGLSCGSLHGHELCSGHHFMGTKCGRRHYNCPPLKKILRSFHELRNTHSLLNWGQSLCLRWTHWGSSWTFRKCSVISYLWSKLDNWLQM